jgi:hypothetical protein
MATEVAPHSGPTTDFGPPPADTYEEKSPVVKELRFFPFKSVADELERPSTQKQDSGIEPEFVKEDTS